MMQDVLRIVHGQWSLYAANTPLDISLLSNGVYLFIIETESGQDVLRWVKQ